MNRRERDPMTGDLFEVPVPADLPAKHDCRSQVSHLVAELLATAPHRDRYTMAAAVSRLAGREVSKYMLDAYSSPAREDHNLPFYCVPALEAACESHLLTSWLADIRGGRLLIGREALNAELGRLEKTKDDITRKIRDLRKQMGEEQ